MLEKDIERTCSAFLELDGWRCLKTDPVSRREWAKGFGEKGMADCLYIRYGQKKNRQYPQGEEDQVMWIEYKREIGGKLTSRAEKAKIHQCAWIAAERARGALVWLAGVDFKPATFEGFEAHYHASGLARNVRPRSEAKTA